MDMQSQNMQYKFNQKETLSLQSSQIFNNYKSWLSDNGVLTHKNLQYPAYFGNSNEGVIGCSAIAQIPSNQTIIAVPYSLIITPSKTKQNPHLMRIIQQNTDIFGLEYEQQFAILLLFLCSQFIKQNKSFYKPYLDICSSAGIGQWDHLAMLAVSNIQATKLMKKQVQRKVAYCQVFINIFKQNPEIFSKDYTDAQYKQFVNKAYDIISTRSFGWPMKQRSLVPMADSLNHNNKKYVNHFVTNIKQINNPNNSKDKTKRILKNMFPQIQCVSVSQQYPKKRSKIQRFISSHKQYLQDLQIEDKQSYILWKQYKQGERKIKQLHFYHDSCEEDNDTNQDQKSKITQGCKEIKNRQLQDNNIINYQNIMQKLKNYWRLYLDPQCKKYQIIQGEQIHEQINVKSKKYQGDQKKHQQQSSSVELSSTSSEQSQEADDEKQNNGTQYIKNEQQNVYVIMATKSSITVHEQLFTFYGRRNNRFLLAGYNFVLPNNKYDSFAFRLNLLNWKNKDQAFQQEFVAPKLIYRYYTGQIRLKQCHLCPQLIKHCRAILIPSFTMAHPIITKISILFPTHKQLQRKTLELAEQILETLQKQFVTTTKEDQQILQLLNKENPTNKYELSNSIKLRLMYKNIIHKNKQFIKFCQLCLQKWGDGRMFVADEIQMKRIETVQSYLQDLQISMLIN